MNRLPAVLAALFVLVVPSTSDADVSAISTVLTNGLTVIVAPVHAAPVVTVGILYKVGSRDETPWTTGIAHQVEHMMFKGTTDLLRPGDIDRRFYDNNATTDQDATYFYESFHKEELESALQIEADRMVNAAMDPVQLAAENVVVLAELENADNDPAELLDEQVEATAMVAHQYHWPTIGWKSVVETFGSRRDLVYDFYSHHYAPQNAVLVITGDVDADAALALVHKYFDGVPARPVNALGRIVEPAQHGVRRINLRGIGSADQVELAFHVPGAYSDEAYALRVLDGILTGGESARLYDALVGGYYVSTLNATPNDSVDPYIYTIDATLEPWVTPDDARAVVERELRKLAAKNVTDAELRKAKKQVIAAYVFQHDGIENLAQWLARWQAWTGDWRNDGRFADRINAVTAGQVRDVARRYLNPDNMTIGTFTTSNAKTTSLRRTPSEPVARLQRNDRRNHMRRRDTAAAIGSSSPAPAGGSATPNTPARFVLDNGLVLIIAENHVSASAVIEIDTAAGSQYDPSQKPGLAALTQEMTLHGTVGKPAEAWQDSLDSLGATLDTALHVGVASLISQTMSQDEPKTMALLADAILHPAFDGDELSAAKAQLIDERRGAVADPSIVAHDQLFRELYPSSNPWSRPSGGTIGGLMSSKRADVLRFYRAHYGPNDTVIVVAGDVDTATVRTQVAGLFGRWQRVRVEAGSRLSGPEPPPATRRKDVVIHGSAQVEVDAGGPGVVVSSPDYDAAKLMNFVLGGDTLLSKMLHQAREVDGYVYNIGSQFVDSPAGGGPWNMEFGARRADVNKVLAEAAAQMRALQQDGISEADLAEYRRLAVDAAVTGELTNLGWAEDLMHDELLGLGPDYTQRLPAIYSAITPAQIQSVAQKYLVPDRLTISTAGP
ncbi:MAG: insulinase family protein [Candidatus Eremiobacteraeota bacterium]|nr:insulinase family protein [Candidatus Eremiobacteraeota bacterium]